MKKLVFALLTLSFSPLSYSSTISVVSIKQDFEKHQKDFSKGDIKEISHVKELLDYMYVFDQEFRELLLLNIKMRNH